MTVVDCKTAKQIDSIQSWESYASDVECSESTEFHATNVITYAMGSYFDPKLMKKQN